MHVVALGKGDDEAGEAAARIYEELRELGVEAVLDDRDAGTGEKLTDAELVGCPLRIVVGRKGLADGVVEAQERRSGEDHRLPADSAAEAARELLGRIE